MYLINEQEIVDQWGPMLENKTGVSNDYKKTWLSKYCHYHSLHESAIFENFSYGTYSSLGGIPGMGSVKPPSAPGGPLSFYTGGSGSGDKFPSLLPLAIQVAAKTIAFDVVSVIPMPGPTGVLTYLDYVYGGGKVNTSQKPLAVKIDTNDINSTKFVNGTHYWATSVGATGAFADNDKAVELIFIGYSRIDGYAIFRVGQTFKYSSGNWTLDASISLSEIFDGSATITTETSGDPTAINTASTAVAVTTRPELVRALEDHIQGFTGAGTYDQDNWSGPYVDGTESANPMGRATGESTYYRVMNIQAYTKSVEAETFHVAATVTTEQIQDLNKQYGIDVLSMLENALVNEISQSINKHILSRLFALGWSNNAQYYKATGETLNFTLDRSQVAQSTSPAFVNKIGFQQTLVVKPYADYGDYENLHTLQRRILSKILAAGNIIAQKGRRGGANFIVTNLQIATALQDNAQYSFAPMTNTINQNNGSLYPLGTVSGMTIYVDPNMSYSDTRVLIGRKGADEEPGLKFMPYLMAESIQTITEGTMAPKIAVKSRYAVVEAGHWPETQYYTLYLKTNGVGLV